METMETYEQNTMAPIRKRLKLNRADRDAWTIKEQLCLVSSILESGDNWLKVSRFMKSFLQKEFQRPRDWFSQKCCQTQYAHLLETANTKKRKQSRDITNYEIIQRLTEERKKEINLLLASQRDEYQQLKYELNLVQTGNLTEEELQKMCLEIDLAEQELEQEKKRKFAIPRKSRSSDRDSKLDPSKKMMEEDGRFLLKNVLKSDLTQSESSQFHQLVPTTVDNATSERSLIGLQRTTLPNLELQTSTKNFRESNLRNEINKIIGDIEKLTIRNITNNPPVLYPESVEVMDSLISELPIVPDKQFEEIEPRRSNIAEMIEFVEKFIFEESKSGQEVGAKKNSMLSEKSKNEEAVDGKGSGSIADLKVKIKKTKVGKKSKENSELTEDPKVGTEEIKEGKEFDKENIIASIMDELKSFFTKEEKENLFQNPEESPYKKLKSSFEKENLSEKSVTMDIKEVDDNEDVDQLAMELNLAKITGDENEPSTEVLSIVSQDPLNVKERDQSREIIWILENGNIDLSSQEKVTKDEENLTIEPVEEGAEPSASSKEDFTIIKEDEIEELRENDEKDFSNTTLIAEVIVDDFKDLEEEEREMAERSDPLKETEDLQSEDNLFMDKEIKIQLPKEVYELCEEASTDKVMKEMKDEKSNNLDEKELTFREKSEGIVMKTYSKNTTAVKRDSEMEGRKESSDYKSWKKAIMLVYDRLATHKYSSVFSKPITDDQALGYSSTILRPMDLTTIKKNIDNGTIRCTKHFQRDVMLMFLNAIMYNKRNSPIYKMATAMQEEFLRDIDALEKVPREESSCTEGKISASISGEASESSAKKRSCVKDERKEKKKDEVRGTGSSRRKKRAKLAKD